MTNLRCWWNGHRYSNTFNEYANDYRVCRYCDESTENIWDGTKSFWERHEDFGVAMKILGLAGIVIFGLFALVMIPMYLSCRNGGILMDIPWKYDFWSGCYYQVKGQWVAKELLEIVELLK